jgi:hypothetical protein
MTGPELALIQKLSHPSQHAFEEGLVELAFLPILHEDPARLFSSICQSLSDCQSLGSIERQRRIGLILNVAPTDSDFCSRLAASAQAWLPPVKNAVVRFLPAENKSGVYGRVRAGTPTVRPTTQQRLPIEVAASQLDTISATNRPEVLLLGTLNEQLSNSRLLEERQFRPRRGATLIEFENLLSGDVCGIVVGSSWWAILASEQHRHFVNVLFMYSSFAWIKVDCGGCNCQAELIKIAKNFRFRDPTTYELVLSESSQINEVDFTSLQRASYAIQNEASVRLCPADIQPAQAQVLIAGVCEHVKARHPRATVRIEEIATTTLDGGLSSALIVRAEPNDGGAPFIAKLAPIEQLRDEMMRFDSYIRPWDEGLRPCFHYHSGTGSIIFGLVATPDHPAVPAPTLDSTLHAALLAETGAPSANQPTERDLFTLISRTVDKIRTLNERRCTDQSLKSLAWMDVSPLKHLVDRGVSWTLPLVSPQFALMTLCDQARMLLNELGSAATVHGDLHLRNVLVRDSREPFLIDYAYAGPGHPCYDLVRFEAALLFQIFRMTDDETAIARLLHSVRDPNTDLESVARLHPELCTSLGNRLAIHALLLCRRACVSLLTDYQAAPRHFDAMQFLIACQSLSNQRLQTGTVRAAVAAFGQAYTEAN